MKSKNLLRSDDAVSVSVGFIIMFSVTVIMFTGLILSFNTLSQNSEKTAMKESFKIIGSELATEITMMDTLVNITSSSGGMVNALEYEISIPASVAGKTYSVNITNSLHKIIIDSDNNARTVSPFNISIDFTDRVIYSGADSYKLKYDRLNNSINME